MTSPHHSPHRSSFHRPPKSSSIRPHSSYLNLNGGGPDSSSAKSQPPPLPTDPPGIYSTLISERDLTQSRKKFVKVTGVGEVELEPDRIEFCIEISSTKADMIAARGSVKKREDYILAALKKNMVGLGEISINEIVSKTAKEDEERSQENILQPKRMPIIGGININNVLHEGFRLVKEIHVSTDSISKYLSLLSLCNEKLDAAVVCSSPIIKFTPSNTQKQTQRALRQAVSNALAKAHELVSSQRTSNLTLGPLVYTIEDSLVIQSQEEFGNSDFELFKMKRHNRRINLKITSVYELDYRREIAD